MVVVDMGCGGVVVWGGGCEYGVWGVVMWGGGCGYVACGGVWCGGGYVVWCVAKTPCEDESEFEGESENADEGKCVGWVMPVLH